MTEAQPEFNYLNLGESEFIEYLETIHPPKEKMITAYKYMKAKGLRVETSPNIAQVIIDCMDTIVLETELIGFMPGVFG